MTANSLAEVAEKAVGCHRIFVIGGAQIYETAIAEGYVNSVIYTDILNLSDHVAFDAFYPELKDTEWTSQPQWGP